jgi:hypothetical protein
VDAFLRRVVELRFLEQEEAIIATPLETFVRRCRVCGRRIGGDTGFECRVCTQCGGAKMHARLAKQDELEAAKRRRFGQLLQLAGFKSQTQEPLMSDRNCTKCGKNLRSNNQGDDCWACRKAAPTDGGPVESGPASRKPKPGVVKRFKVVASALGVDPDNLISEFCEGWLERVRSSANFGSSDA